MSDCLDENAGGRVEMADVSAKEVTSREARASGIVRVRREVLDKLMTGRLAKGDALATARIAAIQGAKRTAEWIPLCHPLLLDCVHVGLERAGPEDLRIECTVRARGPTGVEMEALTAVSAAALTVYDMVKSADRSVVIGPIQLESKSGGKSGLYSRRGNSTTADS
jgi:cyclic pyranopterin phosphate synthase